MKKLWISSILIFFSASALAESGWGEVTQTGNDSKDWGAPQEQASQTVTASSTNIEKRPMVANVCGEDDKRMGELITVLRSLKAGEKIEPLQLTFKTYVNLSDKVRKALGEEFYITSPDCSKTYFFDGELTGKVSLPFTDIWNVTREAIRVKDEAFLSFIVKNTKPEPMSTEQVVALLQDVLMSSEDSGLLSRVLSAKPSYEDSKESRWLLAEVALLMGAKSTGSSKVYLVGSGSKMRHALHKTGFTKVPSWYKPTQIASILSSFGLSPETYSLGEARKNEWYSDK
jgi:hypothetical protein